MPFVVALDGIAVAIAALILAWAVFTLFRPLFTGALALLPFGVGAKRARTVFLPKYITRKTKGKSTTSFSTYGYSPSFT